MTYFKIEKVDVVGRSGGIVALDLGTTPSCLYAHYAPDPRHWPAFYEKVVKMWRTQPHYSSEELGRIRAPTLIVAEEFREIKREHTDRLAKAILDANEIIIEGATHSLLIEKPRIINPQILEFLVH